MDNTKSMTKKEKGKTENFSSSIPSSIKNYFQSQKNTKIKNKNGSKSKNK